jgi:hypothetical protein
MFSGFGASSSPKMSGHAAMDKGFTNFTSEAALGGSTTLTQPGQIVKTLGAATTFLIQVIFRDVTPMPVVYRGKRYVKTQYGEISHPHYIQRNELVCKSGWRVAQVTASGTVLNVAPLDKCFGGLPFVMHRDYEQAFRMWSFGEIDQIISKTRSLNYRSQLVTLALEFAANPVILADAENAASIEGGTVSAGSVVKKKRGSEIRWMEPPQIGPEFFSFYQKQTQDIDVISGIHDVQQGQRPAAQETRDLECDETPAARPVPGDRWTGRDDRPRGDPLGVQRPLRRRLRRAADAGVPEGDGGAALPVGGDRRTGVAEGGRVARIRRGRSAHGTAQRDARDSEGRGSQSGSGRQEWRRVADTRRRA